MEFLILFLIALAGLVVHWLKKWLRSQTNNNFIDYMSINPKHSLSSVTTVFAAIVTMQSAGMLDLSPSIMANAFLAGYGIDSMVNKDNYTG